MSMLYYVQELQDIFAQAVLFSSVEYRLCDEMSNSSTVATMGDAVISGLSE
jgi:hypothetical protein